MTRLLLHGRDPVGDCVVAGDLRWAGTFGVNIDFVARSHCSVAFITLEDIQVTVLRAGDIESGNFTPSRRFVLLVYGRIMLHGHQKKWKCAKAGTNICARRHCWKSLSFSPSNAACSGLLRYPG
jgi:hypothetical protein